MCAVFGTCHDSGDGWGDSTVEELESVVGDLLGCGFVLGFGTRSDHARLEENALKQNIVLSQVEEHLCPHLLGNLESPVNAMLTIKQDFWLHYWDQSIVLKHTTNKFDALRMLQFNIRVIFTFLWYYYTWEMAAYRASPQAASFTAKADGPLGMLTTVRLQH